jgi:hypothetical protein
MRDIRDDLQVRVNFLREQMDAARAQFEKHIDEIKQEHERRLKGLTADLDAVTTLLGAEQRRLGNTPSAPKAPPQPQEPKMQQAQPPQPRTRMPLAEMIGLQRAS